MLHPTARVYLANIKQQYRTYISLGERAMMQLSDEQLNTRLGEDDNSVAMIVRHMVGNMKSRFTDFLTTDGEKPWRNREREFDRVILSRTKALEIWEEGWNIVFQAVDDLRPEELDRKVFIRNEPHTIIQALNRQLGHYAYHVGQIVFLSKYFVGVDWQSLSIPKGKSEAFNKEKFGE
ncbi:MAG: DUF1572 family protein [Bacteroidota bacterium]